MNSDFRVAVDFLGHDKTRELHRKLGANAVLCLLELWSYCATRSIEGRLPGDVDDVERIAHWRGEAGKLVCELLRLHLVDRLDDEYRIHDWAEHQPFIIDAKARIERSRRAGRASAAVRRERFGSAQPPGGRGHPKGPITEQADRLAPNNPIGSNRTPNPTQPNPTQPSEDLSEVRGGGKQKPRRRSPAAKAGAR